MSLANNKITNDEILANGVQSQPNKLTGTAQQNKAVFDALITNLVKGKINGLIDGLNDASAAMEIGVDVSEYAPDVSNLQEALEKIFVNLVDITQGSVADGSITAAKLANNLDYTAVNLDAKQVRMIYVQSAAPTSSSPDGIYLVTG